MTTETKPQEQVQDQQVNIPLDPNAAQPVEYVVIDIETMPASEEAIAAAIDAWKPPANIKDQAKIDSRRLEAEEKIRDKSALLDAAPLSSIGVAMPTGRWIINPLPQKCSKIDGANIIDAIENSEGDTAEDCEAAALMFLRDLLDNACGPETVLAGHNIKAFDLPKLRLRYIFHHLRMPYILQPALQNGDSNQPCCDYIKVFTLYYSVERYRDPFISLEDVARILQMKLPLKVVESKDIPAYAAAGDADIVAGHCLLDIINEEEVYRNIAGLNAIG